MSPPPHGPTAGFLWRETVRFQLRTSFTEHGKTFGHHPWSLHWDGNPVYSGVHPGSPRGSLTTMLLQPECLAAFGPILVTLAWIDQSPFSQCV